MRLALTLSFLLIASQALAAKPDTGVYHGEREIAARAEFAKTGKMPYRYHDAKTRPEFDFDKLLFVKRRTYHSSHFYTDFIDGCDRYGGNISILDLKSGKVTDLFPKGSPMTKGIFGRICLSFDAKKLLFDWKKAQKEGFRIYEVNIDGTGLRQITFPPEDEAERIARYDNSHLGGTARMYYHQTDDMHPCYLPDGGIMFTSTRCEYGTLCDAPDVLTTAVIHRVEADGSNLRPMTSSPVSEFSPTVTEAGWVLYTRWEYVDKGQIGIKCLWAMKPDGTATKEVFGNDIPYPPTMLHGRQIPGNPHKFVMLGTPHWPQSGIGTVITVDTTKPIRTKKPMNFITWWVDVRQEPGWNQFTGDGWERQTNGPLYMDPFPLSENQFLVAHNRSSKWADETAYGLYLLDDQGNHWPILDDEKTSLWQPTPLVAKPCPPVLPSTTDPELAKKNLAVCVVQDVYHGLENVKRGEVKWIRVLEQIPRPWACRRNWEEDARHTRLVSYFTSLASKALYGVVPVEEDGSAHFYVPADRNIYFEALDENFMEIQRERTYVNYKPGERRACIGCHETPNDTPPKQLRPALALSHPPVHPQPQPGDTGPRPLHYVTDVQPVLDKYCISCHSGDSPAADLSLTGELTLNFNQSYQAILDKDLVVTTDEFSDFDGSEYLPAKSIGSHASKFSLQVLKGCPGMKEQVPLEAKVKLYTWVDSNAIYYGSYWGRRYLNWKDHPNFRPVPTFEEAISTKCPIPWDER